MNKADRVELERDKDKAFEQQERATEATNRLAAAMERLADAQEMTAGIRFKPIAMLPAPEPKP